MYTTSSGIIPEVGNRCSAVRKILMNHRVKFEERDLFLSKENMNELEIRMKACNTSGNPLSTASSSNLPNFMPNGQPEVPQVFVDGVWLGVS